MIGPSKILTVSYGTFSCTLEGFDDPFNTMRAIAEYFRDLAAEDRYFGAEPPTPDAAMLLKIAEREVSRRVEAKIQDNSVILRTGDAMQTSAFAPAPQPVPAPAVVQTTAQPTQFQVSQPSAMPDGVAAKLLRIRAAVANAELAEPRPEAAPAPTALAPSHPILADYTEDEHAEDLASGDATFAPDAADYSPTSENVAFDPPTPPASADLAPTLPTETWDNTTLADDLEPANETPESLYADEDFAFPASTSPVQDQFDADPELPVDTAADDDLIASVMTDATPDSDVTPAPTTEVVEATEAAADYDVSDEELADLQALDGATQYLAAVDDTEFDVKSDVRAETDAAEIIAASTDTVEPAPQIDPVLEEIDSAYDTDTASTPGPSAKALRARARVIKVRREDAADQPAVLLNDTAAQLAPIQPTTAPDDIASEVAAMFAADKEADLRRDLRALQQNAAPQIVTQPDTGTEDDAAPEDDARQRLDAAGEAAVSRLIEQTNEAMAVPENRRRLSAIAHLKAAVAATVADRFGKTASAPKEAETKRLDPYRDDLARVVRPLHPTAAEDAPTTPRPAPLVLVSAQRIDRPRAAPSDATPTLTAVPNAPVRPRRVSSAALAVDTAHDTDEDEDDADTGNAFVDARGFAEFSERLGANSLAEILEAAAAYSVCVEGRPYFSRPQLMSQIGALSADSEYTREDGLRTFGAMLREGRIQKIKRGQFILTESSRYLAEARNLSA